MSSPNGPPIGFPAGVDISSSVDGFFYGYFLATVLFGTIIVQGWIYLNNNEDKWPLRSLVALLIVMDFIATILQTQAAHEYLVANFGNIEILFTVVPTIDGEYCILVVITLIVELFFAYRVLKLNPQNYTVPGLIILTAVGGFVAGIITLVEQIKKPSIPDLGLHTRKIEAGFQTGLSALSDVIATLAMSISFFKSRTGIKRTDNVLQMLFLIIVTRGVLLSANQVATLVLYVVHPEKLYWMPVHLWNSKLYVITMVALLNSRASLRGKIGGVNMFAASASRNQSEGVTLSSTSSGKHPGPGALELQPVRGKNANEIGNRAVMITHEQFVSTGQSV